MSILNIVGAKIWGGGEQYVYDICEEFTKNDIHNCVLVDQSNFELQNKFKMVVTDILTTNLYQGKGILHIISIAKMMRERDITSIFCHSGKYILLCILLKKLTGAKIIFFKHNAIPGKSDLYHRWIIKNVDAFICVSKLVYDLQCIEAYKSKYHLVYNGINPNRFTDCRSIKEEKEKLDHKDIVIGYSGRIIKNKGIQELLDAVLEIYNNRSMPIKLLISGMGTDDEIKWLQNYIDMYDMSSYVDYVGFQENMGIFYHQLDILVAPSKVKEAFGLVLCEAMYCGIPVIASQSGAQPEIITDKVTGILLSKVNMEAIQEAIKLKSRLEKKKKKK